jgi:hypothetical protein
MGTDLMHLPEYLSRDKPRCDTVNQAFETAGTYIRTLKGRKQIWEPNCPSVLFHLGHPPAKAFENHNTAPTGLWSEKVAATATLLWEGLSIVKPL